MRKWFVTPALHPDRYLDGPYEDFDTAQARCIVRVDRDTAVRMLAVGKIPGTYVPRLADVTVYSADAPLYRPQTEGSPSRGARAKREPVVRKATVKLPDVVLTYSKSALLVLCDGLGVPRPNDNHLTRDELVDHISCVLATWKRA